MNAVGPDPPVEEFSFGTQKGKVISILTIHIHIVNLTRLTDISLQSRN